MGRLSVLSWLRRDFRNWSRIGNPAPHQGNEHLLTLRRSHLLFHFQHADTAFPFTAWGGQHMPPVSINVGWEGMKLMKLAQNIHTKPDEGKHWSQQGADYEGKHRERPPQGAGAAGGRFKRRRGPLMAAPLTVAPPFGSLCACAAGPHEETAAAPAARLRHVGAARQAHLPHRRQRRRRRWETAGSPPPLRPGAAQPLSPPWASQPRLRETSAFPSALLPLRVAPPVRRDAVLASLFLPQGGWAFLLKYLSEILQSL